MRDGTRSWQVVLAKLSLVFVPVLLLLAPSMASASPVHHTWQAYSGTLCYPNSQTCRTITGTELQNELNGVQMPWWFDVKCDTSASYCPASVAQTWNFQVNGSWVGALSIANPSSGNWFQGYALEYECNEVDNYENYRCIMGTGGPGWSWSLESHY